jgi:hypothetical protein
MDFALRLDPHSHDPPQANHERVMHAPIFEPATLHGIGPQVEEPAVGLNPLLYFAAPYEEMRLTAVTVESYQAGTAPGLTADSLRRERIGSATLAPTTGGHYPPDNYGVAGQRPHALFASARPSPPRTRAQPDHPASAQTSRPGPRGQSASPR